MALPPPALLDCHCCHAFPTPAPCQSVREMLVAGREQELREQGKGVAPLPADQMPTFVCFVLSGCFPDPITVKGNDIWE